MKFGIVFLAALAIALLQQPAYSYYHTQESTNLVVIPESMLEYGNEINRGRYGKISSGTLLYNGVRLPVVIKKDRMLGRLSHSISSEVDALSVLGNHPNIVRMYGVTESNEIVLEYMANGSLLDYVQNNPTLSTSELLRLCIEVCKGMVHMEQKGLVHRDLRARNCLIGTNGEVKINDFGLTRRERDTNGRALYSKRIAAPEIRSYRDRDQFTSKSDVWAFGLLMWEVFTFGREVPFSFGSPRHQDEINDYLSQPSGFPDQIYNVMMLCLQQDPNERPSFYELLSKLNELYQASPYQHQFW